MEWLQALTPLASALGAFFAGRKWDLSSRSRKNAQIRDDLDLWRSMPSCDTKRDLLSKIELELKEALHRRSKRMSRDQIILAVCVVGLLLGGALYLTYIPSPTEEFSSADAIEALMALIRLVLSGGVIGFFALLILLPAFWIWEAFKVKRKAGSSPPA